MNLRQIRKKIKSIVNVKKITRAMQLVSAVKMKKAQQDAVDSMPYREYLNLIVKKAMSLVDKNLSPLIYSHSKNQKELNILISSNKGLCGSFNFNLFRFLLKNIDFQKTEFITLGKKGSLFLSKIGAKIIADFSSGNFLNSVSAIAKEATTKFLNAEFEKVNLIYNHFISALRFEVRKEDLLPITLDFKEDKITGSKLIYQIEPDPQTIINKVLENLIEEKIRGAIIESQAAEHSARMIAMKNATDNANEIIYNLTLLKNKVRQEKITNELLDMVSAKISVEGV